MSKRQANKEVFLIISSFLLGGLVMFGFIKFTPFFLPTPKCYTPQKTVIVEKNSLSTTINKVKDAVVLIQGYENGSQETTGSGFIYKTDNKYGYILTNEHIIAKSDSIKVILSTDEKINGTLLGKDKYLDLAVLRIDKKYVSQIAVLGHSEDAQVGDMIFALGSPMGYDYRNSVTSGIISGKDRLVSLASEEAGSWKMQVIQIDASLNPGSSGGPLLNINGDVIGICAMKLIDEDIEGMAFAIPVEYAINHMESLEKGENIKWPVLGIEMINVSDSISLAKNEIHIDNQKEGVVITSIKENSSIASSNMQKGDIITKINGKSIKNIATLRYEVYQYQSGDIIEITYIRNGKEYQERVTLKD